VESDDRGRLIGVRPGQGSDASASPARTTLRRSPRTPNSQGPGPPRSTSRMPPAWARTNIITTAVATRAQAPLRSTPCEPPRNDEDGEVAAAVLAQFGIGRGPPASRRVKPGSSEDSWCSIALSRRAPRCCASCVPSYADLGPRCDLRDRLASPESSGRTRRYSRCRLAVTQLLRASSRPRQQPDPFRLGAAPGAPRRFGR
jgi:hypothetical protein